MSRHAPIEERDTPLRPARPEAVAIAAVAAAIASFLLWWWSRHRRTQPWFIDEAGYVIFALSNAAALGDGSMGELWDGIDAQAPVAPLLPLVSSVPLALVDRPAAVAAATMAGSVAALVLATWWLARMHLPPAWAVLAGGLVGTLPTTLSLGGTYYFAPAAAACFTAGLACLERGGWGRSPSWSAAAGASFAAAALSRTMLIGYFPAVAATAAGVVAWRWWREGEDPRRRVGGLLTAAATSAIVLAPWFLRNLDPILDYLGGNPPVRGSGAGSTGGGGGAWKVRGMRDVRLLVGDLLVPMAGALVLTAIVVIVVGLRARRHPVGAGDRSNAPAPAPGARLAPLATVVAFGTLTLGLTSEAVGQWLPLLPPILVVLIAELRRAVPTRVTRTIVAALVALSLFNVASASRIDDSLSRLRLVDAGPLGRLPVTDTRTLLEDQLTPLLQGGPLDERFLAVPVLLDRIVTEAIERARAVGEPAVLVVTGMQDPLVNENSLPLAEWRSDRREADEVFIVGALPLDDALDDRGWSQVLTDPERGQPNTVVTILPTETGGPSGAAYDVLVATLPNIGFQQVFADTLPDGRPVRVWFRARADAGT